MTSAEVAGVLGIRSDAWCELQPQCDVIFSILTMAKNSSRFDPRKRFSMVKHDKTHHSASYGVRGRRVVGSLERCGVSEVPIGAHCL